MSESREKNIQRIIHLMQTDDSVDAPESAVRWAKNIFRTRQEQPSALQRIKAVLKIDLAPGRAVFGERSGQAEARQMLFQAGEIGIDLRISVSDTGFDIHGQVLGTGFEKQTASLGGYTSETNDQGEFRFESIPAGSYAFTVNNGEEEIVVEGIEIT